MNEEIEKLELPQKPKRPLNAQFLFQAEYRKKNPEKVKG